MRSIILGGIFLPFKLYFRPDLFRAEVAALAPELPEDYGLWGARHKLRDSEFSWGLLQLLLQVCIALLWVTVFVVLLQSREVELDWIYMERGVAFGIAIGMLMMISGSLGDVAGSIAWGIAFAIMGSFLAVSMIVDGADSNGAAMAFFMALGGAPGVACSGAFGTAIRTAIRKGRYQSLGGMVVFASFAIVTHSLFLPLHALVSLTSARLVRFRPAWAPALWYLSPVRWHAIILLPLPGLSYFLVTLYRQHPTLGQRAISEVAAHLHQKRAAAEALATLTREEALAVDSLPALVAFGQGFSWLTETTLLSENTHWPLLHMRDISKEIASASTSESATNQVHHLMQADHLLDVVRHQPGPFGSALAQWTELITTDLEEARQRQRELEPIPHVYQSNGQPLDPWQKPEHLLTFKGRDSLFSQLEAALDDEHQTPLFLYGSRQIGKTSFLKYLPQRLDHQVVPALIDMQDFGIVETITDLIEDMVHHINNAAQRHANLIFPVIDINNLERYPYATFHSWLDQVERMLGAQTLLLVFDGVEELEQLIATGRIDDRLLITLQNIVSYRRQIAVLLAGSHELEELPSHWSHALGQTETLTISFLGNRATRSLIEQPVADFPAIYTPKTIDAIVRLTSCQPYLVQLVCALLVERMNSMRRMPPTSYVTPEDVETIIPLALERGHAYFDHLWGFQTETALAQRVLAKLATAPDTALDGSALRQIERDEMALAEALRVLQRREIIVRENGCYRIVVPLVAHYVRRETLV